MALVQHRCPDCNNCYDCLEPYPSISPRSFARRARAESGGPLLECHAGCSYHHGYFPASGPKSSCSVCPKARTARLRKRGPMGWRAPVLSSATVYPHSAAAAGRFRRCCRGRKSGEWDRAVRPLRHSSDTSVPAFPPTIREDSANVKHCGQTTRGVAVKWTRE